MNESTALLLQAKQQAAARLSDFIKIHQRSMSVSFSEHVTNRRKELLAVIENRKIIYLDTNAWKCVSDFKRGKTLSSDMSAFCKAITSEDILSKCVFPIGLSTLFELQSMDDPLTLTSFAQFIDEFSSNLCIASQFEILEAEKIAFDESHQSPQGKRLPCIRRPFEIYGIPELNYHKNNLFGIDENTFQKAFYDALSQLSISQQLAFSFESNLEKWDNRTGIADMNINKIKHHSSEIKLTTFEELMGTMEYLIADRAKLLEYLLPIINHWKNYPQSTHFAFARILSILHGLMRVDNNKPYKQGDLTDFFTAATALPDADAFFTDKRLYYIIHDNRIDLSAFINCKTIFGFKQFAEYLENL